MKRRIHELLDGKLKKSKSLKEAVKIRKSEPTRHGYFVFMTSDEGNSDASNKEAANMGYVLNLTKAGKSKWKKDFNAPEYFKDAKTGRFGWGYLIHPALSDEQVDKLLNNLKTLVSDYNSSKNLGIDLETAGLTPNQIERLQEIVQAVETTEEVTQNTAVKANLDKYLTELENAVENDEVYEFLIQTYEQAKTFQTRNTAWKYSVLNSLIITKSDPTATLAGPEQYWSDRNYKIKEDYKNKGIIITKWGSKKSDVFDKAKWFKDNPDKFQEFKRDNGLGADVRYDEYVKKNAYQLAKYATEKKLVKAKGMQFSYVPTYTDTMVEPIPGKEVEPVGNDLYVKEKGVESMEIKEKLYNLFGALSDVAKENGVSTAGISSSRDDINEFNKILNAISSVAVTKKLSYLSKDKAKQTEANEMLKAYSEMVSHIVKRHYGLPSESSKYNIASFGGDKSSIQKESNIIINIADKIIDGIDASMSQKTQALNEIRAIVRSVLKGS